MLLRCVLWMFPVSLIVLNAGVAYGQNYPSKPIRVVTSQAGGGADLIGRLIAQGVAGPLGQQVIIENRPSGIIPGEIVAKAPPDGYTLLLTGGSLWIGPFMQSVPYDPVRDFSPVSLTNTAPYILAVNPSLPVKSVKDLIALARARPGELNYSSSGAPGGTSHLAGELLKAMAHVDIVRVNYKGTGDAISQLIGGQVQLTYAPVASVTPHVKANKLRALAVTSAQPSALYPGVPTVAASGLPGYELSTVYGIFTPAKAPAALINRLNQELVRFLNTAEAKERFLSIGVESVGSSPDEFAAAVRSDMTRLGKIIKDAGIKGE